jgi:hypothetical protein
MKTGLTEFTGLNFRDFHPVDPVHSVSLFLASWRLGGL